MLRRKGLSFFLIVKCSTYSISYSTYTSKGVKNNTKVMEVNLRSVYATRCGVMSLLPPVTRKKYDNLSNKLDEVVEM